MIEGKLIDKFPHNRERDLPQVSLIFVLLVIGGIAYVALGPELLFASSELVTVLAIMIPLSLVAAVRSAYRLWLKPSVSLFENGLRYEDKRRSQFWAWDAIGDIRALRTGISQTGRYGLYSEDRRVLLLDDCFQRSAVLVNRLLAELLKRKDYAGLLEQGESLHLGKLDITAEGVQLPGQNRVPWAAVRAINQLKHMNECQIIHSNGKPITVKTRAIPNAPLLIQFMAATWEQRIHAPQPETAQPDSASPPQAMIEARFLWYKSVFQIVLALIGIGAAVVVIVPSIHNALDYNLIDWGWLRDSSLALIIPIISLSVLLRQGLLLFQNPRLVADETGLHRYTRSGENHWPWNTLSDVKFVKLFGWFATVRVGLEIAVDDQPVLAMDNRYAHMDALGKMTQQMHTAARYAHFRKQLDSGRPLTFGPITLDQIGMQFGGKSYPWSQIKSFDMQKLGNETHLIVYGHDDKRLFAATVFRISNIQILAELLHERLTGEAPKFVK